MKKAQSVLKLYLHVECSILLSYTQVTVIRHPKYECCKKIPIQPSKFPYISSLMWSLICILYPQHTNQAKITSSAEKNEKKQQKNCRHRSTFIAGGPSFNAVDLKRDCMADRPLPELLFLKVAKWSYLYVKWSFVCIFTAYFKPITLADGFYESAAVHRLINQFWRVISLRHCWRAVWGREA